MSIIKISGLNTKTNGSRAVRHAGGRGGNAYRRHIACSGAAAEAQLCRKPTLAPEGLPEANACGFGFCLRRPPVATLANGMG
jgi:hypothetical protein